MSEGLPDGWEYKKLGELFEFQKDSVIPNKFPDEVFEYYSIPALDNFGSCINEKGIEIHSNKTLLSKPTILVSKLNPRKPRVVLVDENTGKRKCASTEFMPYVKVIDNINLIFYKWYFSSNLFHQRLDKVATGSTNSHVRVPPQETFRWKIPHPPLPEQKKISKILTSVDEVIETTESQINKLKDLKKGMMNALLTQGIRHTEFKDTPVGRIPVGWEVKKIEDLSDFVTSGSRGWAQYYSKQGALFLRIGNLTREHINFRFNDVVYVTPPNSTEGKRTLVQDGDILISITADLGIIGVVNTSLREAYVNQHISLVRIKNKIEHLPRWIGHYLSNEYSQRHFTDNNDSGAKAGLNLTSIRKTYVVFPEVEEQLKIVKTLDSIDKTIRKKKTKKYKLISD